MGFPGDIPRQPFNALFWGSLTFMAVAVGGVLFALKKGGLW
jgi:hypothetical protein